MEHVDIWADRSRHPALWRQRTEAVAKFIEPGASVFEFGAGTEHLSWYRKDIIYESVSYLIGGVEDPTPPESKADYALAAGVLEYVESIAAASRHMALYADKALVTYWPEGLGSRPEAVFRALWMVRGAWASFERVGEWNEQGIWMASK